ncbi:hypothetical protein [Bacterioplanoides sp.]|uniref:hypothetical protein n=1 Tax=Bacterioplanoides sp. TaxID=2066072 RepID=UPI003B00ACFB
MIHAIKRILLMPALLIGFQSQAATEDLDQLLTSIRADIQNQRLSSPAGNNALERITSFREQAPFDFRVVPLTYEWGEAYVALANKATDAGQLSKAQGYLDKVWYVAALTPGLEEAQAKLDSAAKSGKKVVKPAKKASGPSKEELARQKKLEQELAKEKARLEAELKRKQELAKKEALAEKKRMQAEKKRKEEVERQRRLAAAKAEKEAAAKAKKAAAAAAASKASVAKTSSPKTSVAKKSVPAPVVAPVPIAKQATAAELGAATALWQSAKEDSVSIASYPVSADMVANRDRNIAGDLEPVCQAILDNDASVVVHTADKADYRWLTVRLTLCLRRLDKSFRLRHSYLASADTPSVSLHPSRGVSLVRKVER